MVGIQGRFKSSLLPVMLVLGVLMAVYAIASDSVYGPNISQRLNATNISVVGKLTGTGSGTQGFMMQWVNVSGTMFFNVTLNTSNGTSTDASFNVTNVSLMFRHRQNESIMGNFTATNNTVDPGNGGGIGLRGPRYWNISVDTTTMPDGVYDLFVLMNNQSAVVAPTGGFIPVTNATIATNVSVDNSPPNVSVTGDGTATSQNLTAVGNADANANMKGFNATVSDASFYYLHPDGKANGTNVANVTFSFDNTSGSPNGGVGFNITVGQGGADGGQGNMTPTNSTNAIWNVSVNLSALHAGEHSVRVFAYNWHGKLNFTRTFNFTLNTPHNVTYMSSPTGEVVTQFVNYSARNTQLMFNISVINATNATTGFPNAPIVTVIGMFDNASGNDFNLSNGSNVVTSANGVPQAMYFNLSYNVSALQEGNNTVTFFVNDTLGNHNKTTYVSFFVDKTAPNVTNLYINVSNGTNFTRTGVLLVNATVNDSTFVVNVTFEVINRNNGSQFNLSGTRIMGSWMSANLTLFDRGDGVYDVRVYANDSVATMNNSLQNVSFTVDGTAPNVSNLYINVSNGTNISRAGVIQINASVNDTVTTIHNVTFEIINRHNGTQFNVSANKIGGYYTVDLNMALRADGLYDVRVYANDTLHNVNNSLINVSFTVDGTVPNVTWVTVRSLNYSAINTTTLFNVSIGDLTPRDIIFSFNNVSSNGFNLTASNSSGHWNISYNVSELAEGNHTVRVFANDTQGNINLTEIIHFFVDKTAPALTITCTPSEPKEGETVSCTCSASDSGTGLKSNARFTGGTASESTVASGIGQKDTSVCSAEDYVDNRNEKKGSYTVVSSASGGGGGGGSGGGASSSTGTSGVKKVWASINAGETATITANKEGLSVTAVDVKVAATVYGAWVQVKSVEKTDLPAQASQKLVGKVYDLIEISENKIALKEATVAERSVAFKVEKSWLGQNGLDKNDVALLRYNDEQWTALSTTATSEDAVNVEYKAMVPGFSFFAVGEKSAATAVAPAPGEEGAEPTPAPTTGTAPTPTTDGDAMMKEEGGSLTWLWVVLVLAVLAGAVYFVKNKKRK